MTGNQVWTDFRTNLLNKQKQYKFQSMFQKHTFAYVASGTRGFSLTPFSCDFCHSSTPVNCQKLHTHSHLKIYSNYNNTVIIIVLYLCCFTKIIH